MILEFPKRDVASAPEPTREVSSIVVRTLRAADLEDVIRIDAKNFGKPRREYYRLKLELAMNDTSVRMSLGAELDGKLAGFLFGSLFYGDFGVPEPIATLDSIGVHAELGRHGVATALYEQFLSNLKAMRIDRVRTQVPWGNWQLMTFFHKMGFVPGTHICLDRPVNP